MKELLNKNGKNAEKLRVMEFLKPYPKTLILLGLSLAFSLFCLLSLMKDIDGDSWNASQKQFGKVLKTTREVKRKNVTSLMWNKLSDKNHLFFKDSILVGRRSDATLDLTSGEEIELGEDSFFMLDPSRKIEDSPFRGTLVVNEKGQRTLLETKSDGTLQKTQLSVSLKSPKNHETFFLIKENRKAVDFDWVENSDTTISSPQLQLSENPKFLGNRVPNPSNSKSFLLKPGTYYWRLVEGESTLSETYSFTVEKIEPLKPFSPFVSENIVRSDLVSPLTFTWKKSAQSNSSQRSDWLQVSSESDFKEKWIDREVLPSTGFIEEKILKAGTYYWRLLTKAGDETLESETRSFQITQSDIVDLKPLFPADNTVVKTGEPILFRWQNSNSASENHIEIVDYRTKKPLIFESVRGQSFSWKEVLTGQYMWRISAKNALRTLASSDWRLVTVTSKDSLALKSPADKESHIFWEKPETFTFEWEKDLEATEYMVEFSNSHDFKKLLSSRSNLTTELKSEDAKLPLGSIYWRVRALDSNQVTLNLSQPRLIVYDHPELLKAPTQFKPESGSHWDVVKEGKEALIQWDPIEEAKAYAVSVEKEGATVFNTQVEKPELALTRFKSGKYKISVSAIDRLGRVGVQPEKPMELIVKYSSLTAPEAEAPEVK